MIKSRQRGQMLLVVVLTMIIALTVGLSVASRNITNLKISRQGEESQRAFQAAEAGVEQILQAQPACTPGATCSFSTLTNSSSYTTKVSYPEGKNFLLNGGELVDQATGIDVWLSNYPDFLSQISGTITVYWGTENHTSCSNLGGAAGPATVLPALEIVVLSGNILTPVMTKKIVESNNTSGGACTRITAAVPPGAGGTPPGSNINFRNSTPFVIAGASPGLIMRVIPIFNSTKIAISSTVDLPKQGSSVESTGTSGQTTRKVQYFTSYPQIPVEVFPYALITQ